MKCTKCKVESVIFLFDEGILSVCRQCKGCIISGHVKLKDINLTLNSKNPNIIEKLSWIK